MTTKPKNLPDCLQQLAALMKKEDAARAKLKPISDEIEALRDYILEQYSATELDSVTAAGLRVQRVVATVPSLKDLDAFLAFATKKANWDLLAGSVNSRAWTARNQDGKPVPGVEPFNRVSLRVTRVGTKA